MPSTAGSRCSSGPAPARCRGGTSPLRPERRPPHRPSRSQEKGSSDPQRSSHSPALPRGIPSRQCSRRPAAGARWAGVGCDIMRVPSAPRFTTEPRGKRALREWTSGPSNRSNPSLVADRSATAGTSGRSVGGGQPIALSERFELVVSWDRAPSAQCTKPSIGSTAASWRSSSYSGLRRKRCSFSARVSRPPTLPIPTSSRSMS